ncbi:MAG TPA: chromosome segregation protein SMC, partial [Firmicutes bacterium]|nr:chromosome segregation protein SMC [Bacillota bacterium]
LEEYTALKERYDFLVTQKSDLEEAKGQLEEAMERIDQISKEKFLDTFYQISENFKQIFPLLFNGGKADITLVMEDGDDILEAGIDVNVKPPGKRLQNIDLLSGGEKALSAIALLFSIFKVKPAPFCVLDEIDAPLDDANIARFIKMLSEFTETTQFIIVSHNKYTMEMADALYGVTMDEPGVSKIVSVQFREGA